MPRTKRPFFDSEGDRATEPPRVGDILHDARFGKLRVTKVVPTDDERWARGPVENSYEFSTPGISVPTHTIHYEIVRGDKP